MSSIGEQIGSPFWAIPMITLYDVLGARADDDAEALKKAFRNVVKASHPDLHGNEPHSTERFRQIIRANAILSDPDQRALYDHLLAFERWQERSKTRRGLILDTLRNLAADTITVVLLATLLSGGYLVFMHLNRSSVSVGSTEVAGGREVELPSRPPEQQEGQVRPAIRLSRQELHALLTGPGPAAPAMIAGPIVVNVSQTRETAGGVATHLNNVEGAADGRVSDTKSGETQVGRAKIDAASSSEVKSSGGKISETETSETETSETKTGETKISETKISETKTVELQVNEVKAGESPLSDPQFYLERGVASYRDGDLDRALADFNKAILLDPQFTSAYLNRSIVLYRKAEVDRAFADVAQAVRMQDALKPMTRSRRRGVAPPRN